MNMKYSFFKFLKLMISAIILIIPMTMFAKEINLYDQPKSDAKMIGTIDLSAGVIPIYTPKEGRWVKIADPKNGNVGWVKSSELNNAGTSQSIFTFTQSIDNKRPTTYRIIQFGQPTNLTPEQTKILAKQVQAEQQEIQKSIQNMMRNMDQLFYNGWHFLHHETFPFFVPVVLMPVQKSTQPPQVNKQPTLTQNNVDNKIKK
jgi:Bacterial SH3 domain